MATLSLSAGVMFIIEQSAPTSDAAESSTTSEKIPASELHRYTQRAVWTVTVSLVVIILSMTVLALLDESLDRPGTLRINNRLGRLSGRLVYVLIIILVPLYEGLNPQIFLGVCSLLLVLLSLWEWVVSTDKDGFLFEPRRSAEN